MSQKSDEFRKASDKVNTIALMNFIHDDYKKALKMACKALDTLEEFEKLKDISGEAKP